MICPKCKRDNTKVTRTLQLEDYIRRYRKCIDCGHTFTTVETYSFNDLVDEYLRYHRENYRGRS